MKSFFIALENDTGIWKTYCYVGDYGNHPRFGHIEFTPRKLESFIENFKKNVIGKDVTFNFNHKSGPSPLTILDLRLKKDEAGNIVSLEYLPEYTPAGKTAIDTKEYKYLSPEYSDDFEGNGPTILGGAFTNDPFLVGDGLVKLENTKEEENFMDPKELEKISTELQALKESVKKLEAENKNLQAEKKKIEDNKKTKELESIPENENYKKLQAIELERAEDKKLIQLQGNELLKMRVKTCKMEWMQSGIPGGMITVADKRILESCNGRISLENGKNDMDLISIYSEVFSALPADKRVHLSQEEDSGVWVNYLSNDKKEENSLITDAKKRGAN